MGGEAHLPYQLARTGQEQGTARSGVTDKLPESSIHSRNHLVGQDKLFRGHITLPMSYGKQNRPGPLTLCSRSQHRRESFQAGLHLDPHQPHVHGGFGEHGQDEVSPAEEEDVPP